MTRLRECVSLPYGVVCCITTHNIEYYIVKWMCESVFIVFGCCCCCYCERCWIRFKGVNISVAVCLCIWKEGGGALNVRERDEVRLTAPGGRQWRRIKRFFFSTLCYTNTWTKAHIHIDVVFPVMSYALYVLVRIIIILCAVSSACQRCIYQCVVLCKKQTAVLLLVLLFALHHHHHQVEQEQSYR